MQAKIENNPAAIERLVRRLEGQGTAEFVYEAGPCGYDMHRQIAALGRKCAVIAPALTPVKPGDHIKNDRRDAEKLARYYRSGDLTAIRVPTLREEAARDIVRVREDALVDRLRVRNRLQKFLLRQGRIFRGARSWGKEHREWISAQRFEWMELQQSFEAYVHAVEEAEARLARSDRQIEDLAATPTYRQAVSYLRCLKGVETLSALTLVVEAQEFRRFLRARSFMGYGGLGIKENTTGFVPRRGGITKAGNAHIRRILVESAWNYRGRNGYSKVLNQRRQDCPAEIVQIARKAQDRLHRKFAKLIGRGKSPQTAAVAVARELAGFVWAIAQHFPVLN
jgi:transposase